MLATITVGLSVGLLIGYALERLLLWAVNRLAHKVRASEDCSGDFCQARDPGDEDDYQARH